MRDDLPDRPHVTAVILDWAGTTVDFGCFAPTLAFVAAFRARGVEIAASEARGPMGLEKKEHLRALLSDPSIRARWLAATTCEPTPGDVERLYAELETGMKESVRVHAEIVPGTLELVAELRGHGIPVGSTTGYAPAVMEILRAEASRRGYAPDVSVCPADVPAGRPAPWMCYLNAVRMAAYPLWCMVKIGDTPVDMQEGVNAGMWTIGVTESGNEIGLTREELGALPSAEHEARTREAARRLREAGARFVAGGVWDCLSVIREIDERLRRGERPGSGAVP